MSSPNEQFVYYYSKTEEIALTADKQKKTRELRRSKKQAACDGQGERRSVEQHMLSESRVPHFFVNVRSRPLVVLVVFRLVSRTATRLCCLLPTMARFFVAAIIVALFVVCFAAPSNDIWTNCGLLLLSADVCVLIIVLGTSADHFQIKNVVLTPYVTLLLFLVLLLLKTDHYRSDPPVRGQNFTVSASGYLGAFRRHSCRLF